MTTLGVISISTRVYDIALDYLSGVFGSTQGARLAALVVAQGKFESTNFSSSVFKQYDNGFGYGYTGKAHPYMYKDYTALPQYGFGALDVAKWISKYKDEFANVTTCREYAALLIKHDYVEGSGATVDNYGGGMEKYYTPPLVASGDLAIGVAFAVALTACYVANKMV